MRVFNNDQINAYKRAAVEINGNNLFSFTNKDSKHDYSIKGNLFMLFSGNDYGRSTR